MDVLNARIWEKYQHLKKRKTSEVEESNKVIETNVKKYQLATEEMVGALRRENDALRNQIYLKEDEFAENQKLLMEERRKTKELFSEVERLNNIITSRKDCLEESDCKVIARLDSPSCTPEFGSRRALRKHAELLAPNSSCDQEHIQNGVTDIPRQMPCEDQTTCEDFISVASQPDCCRVTIPLKGDKMEEHLKHCVFQTLLESIVGMKFSVDGQADIPHFLVVHQSSGYSFKLVWLPSSEGDSGEWLYQVLSLGTLERVALDWMKEDIIFSSTMFPHFFHRLSRALGRVQ